MVDVPHLAWPLRLDGTSLAVVEQDSQDDIIQCVALVTATDRGSRVELPDFGIDDPTFTHDLREPDVLAQIEEWEPRATVDVTAGDLTDQVARFRVTVAGGQGPSTPGVSLPPAIEWFAYGAGLFSFGPYGGGV